jgi:ankyrin repeat protein
MASIYGHTATVEVLLEAGADKEARNVVRETKREITTRTRVADKMIWRRYHVTSSHCCG